MRSNGFLFLLIVLCVITSPALCTDEEIKKLVNKDKRKNETIRSNKNASLNCTYLPSPRRWKRRRRQRLRTRTAYRMAILASLAYRDFRRVEDYDYACFSLRDDPTPPRQLLSMAEKAAGRREGRRLLLPHRFLIGLMLHWHLLLCRMRHDLVSIRLALQNAFRKASPTKPVKRKKKTICRRSLLDRHNAGTRYQIEWTLQNWHEATLPQIRWHDTDLIIATSGSSEIVLAFAGTASTADQFTNVQTFEPVAHSGLFGNATIEGSIHRGFLNAYSRVVRGTIARLCDNDQIQDVNNDTATMNNSKHRCKTMLTQSLHERYDECMSQSKKATNVPDESDSIAMEPMEEVDNRTKSKGKYKKKEKAKKKKKKRKRLVGCKSHGERLMDILRQVVTDALRSGYTVNVAGHSLGGGIASLLALDIIMNHPSVPISKLHLWTFGAPEVADSAFYESATMTSSRLRAFLRDKRRYHRFVTRAGNCATDFVATLASKSLNRRAARRLGGVRGSIIHPVVPAYVPLLRDGSGIEGHHMANYLKGISIESPDHPLSTDFPPLMSKWLGEGQWDNRTLATGQR